MLLSFYYLICNYLSCVYTPGIIPGTYSNFCFIPLLFTLLCWCFPLHGHKQHICFNPLYVAECVKGGLKIFAQHYSQHISWDYENSSNHHMTWHFTDTARTTSPLDLSVCYADLTPLKTHDCEGPQKIIYGFSVFQIRNRKRSANLQMWVSLIFKIAKITILQEFSIS